MKRSKYLRKSHIEKNSSDREKLSKVERRSQQKGIRQLNKNLSEAVPEIPEDNRYENELKMANLCYKVSEFIPDLKCTCPNPANEEMVQNHLDYLNKLLVGIMK